MKFCRYIFPDIRNCIPKLHPGTRKQEQPRTLSEMVFTKRQKDKAEEAGTYTSVVTPHSSSRSSISIKIKRSVYDPRYPYRHVSTPTPKNSYSSSEKRSRTHIKRDPRQKVRRKSKKVRRKSKKVRRM